MFKLYDRLEDAEAQIRQFRDWYPAGRPPVFGIMRHVELRFSWFTTSTIRFLYQPIFM